MIFPHCSNGRVHSVAVLFDETLRHVLQQAANSVPAHESRGHWPGCGACVQARGRTPARRIRNDAEPEGLGADFLFFGSGKYWKVLILVMFATGMLGMVAPASRKHLIRS